jgi:hypothetical protein
MRSDDEYRRQAVEAQRHADHARNDLDRESWLRIAQGWLGLIRKPKPTAQDAFGAEVAEKRSDDGNTSKPSSSRETTRPDLKSKNK